MASLPELRTTCTEAEELRSDRTDPPSSTCQRGVVWRVTEAPGGRLRKSEWLPKGRKCSTLGPPDHGLPQGPEEEAAKLKAKEWEEE